jgi:hypothetical protein
MAETETDTQHGQPTHDPVDDLRTRLGRRLIRAGQDAFASALDDLAPHVPPGLLHRAVDLAVELRIEPEDLQELHDVFTEEAEHPVARVPPGAARFAKALVKNAWGLEPARSHYPQPFIMVDEPPGAMMEEILDHAMAQLAHELAVDRGGSFHRAELVYELLRELRERFGGHDQDRTYPVLALSGSAARNVRLVQGLLDNLGDSVCLIIESDDWSTETGHPERYRDLAWLSRRLSAYASGPIWGMPQGQAPPGRAHDS